MKTTTRGFAMMVALAGGLAVTSVPALAETTCAETTSPVSTRLCMISAAISRAGTSAAGEVGKLNMISEPQVGPQYGQANAQVSPEELRALEARGQLMQVGEARAGVLPLGSPSSADGAIFLFPLLILLALMGGSDGSGGAISPS